MDGTKIERVIFLIDNRNWLNEDRVKPSNVSAVLNPTKQQIFPDIYFRKAYHMWSLLHGNEKYSW